MVDMRDEIMKAPWDQSMKADGEKLIRDGLERMGQGAKLTQIYSRLSDASLKLGISMDDIAWAFQASAVTTQQETLRMFTIRFLYAIASRGEVRIQDFAWLEDELR